MRLKQSFYQQDALDLAPVLLGKTLVRQFDGGLKFKDQITEIEVYRGEEDLGCHASKGKTPRTSVMYLPGGAIYVYLIYGMYWLLNIVTEGEHHPQAILIRSLKTVEGPGRVGRALKLDKSFYGESLVTSQRLWFEDSPLVSPNQIITTPRIGIDYAKEWKDKPWRFLVKG